MEGRGRLDTGFEMLDITVLESISSKCFFAHCVKLNEAVPGLQKTDFLPVQTDFKFVKPIQFA